MKKTLKVRAEQIKEKGMQYLNEVCKMGQGALCCRYIIAGAEGIRCAKLTSLKETIDIRVELGQFTAKADNCIGVREDVDLAAMTLPDK